MICSEFDAHLVSDDPEDRAVLEAHARECSECGRRLAFERRLEVAARSLRPQVPPQLWEAIEQQRRTAGPLLRPAVVVPLAAALAASLLLAVLFLRGERDRGGPTPGSDSLLGDAALEQALATDRRQQGESDRLEQRIENEQPAAATDDPRSPLLEEVAFLEDAIAECRRALEINPRHAHLRRQLEQCRARHLDLLRRLTEEERG